MKKIYVTYVEVYPVLYYVLNFTNVLRDIEKSVFEEEYAK